jgi:hypothetical protein
VIAHTYQGNAWWIALAIFVLFMMAHVIFAARARYKAGFPVNTQQTIGLCVMFLLFVAFAVYQVMTHQLVEQPN